MKKLITITALGLGLLAAAATANHKTECCTPPPDCHLTGTCPPDQQ